MKSTKLDTLLGEASELENPSCRVFVRIRTSAWHDRNGIGYKKEIKFIKRKCEGHNFVLEDADNIGAREVVGMFNEDIFTLPDGAYEVHICNERKDWETGVVDDYDYRLSPIKP